MTAAKEDRARYNAALDAAVELINAKFADVANRKPGKLANPVVAGLLDDLKTDIDQLPALLSALGDVGGVAVLSWANDLGRIADIQVLRQAVVEKLRSGTGC